VTLADELPADDPPMPAHWATTADGSEQLTPTELFEQQQQQQQ
jgi:hypothetical protein